MPLDLNFKNLIHDTIGESGLTLDEIFKYEDELYRIRNEIKDYPFLNIIDRDYSDVFVLGNQISKEFDYFVLIGIGGSSLGTEMLFRALKCMNYNQKHFPKFYVLDNVDPDKVASVLESIEPEKTCFNVVSKSGNTLETITNFLLVLDVLKEKVKNWEKHFIFTTANEEGFLAKFGREKGIRTIFFPKEISGRFSIFTEVGILPASILKINVDELLNGASQTRENFLTKPLDENASLLLAIIYYLLYKGKNKKNIVMIPYAERLDKFVDWWRQLFAESLGKDSKGFVPIKGLGTIDQHSQIQLYLDGPKENVITFIEVKKFERDFKISSDIPRELSYLQGKILSNILQGELVATSLALAKRGVPNLTLSIDELSPENIGKLTMLYEIVTVLCAKLFEVDPFNQPAVEEVKGYMYKWLKGELKQVDTDLLYMLEI